jgi:hypothetical protein
MKEQVTAGTSWRCPQNERSRLQKLNAYLIEVVKVKHHSEANNQRGHPMLQTLFTIPTALSENAVHDISEAFEAASLGRVCVVPQNQKLSLAYVRPALPRLSFDAG